MTTAVPRPPLVRGGDRVIAGVCTGLARHLDWPVRMVRLGMVAAALAGGAGVVFYAWLWIMVPTADESAKRDARQPASPIAPAVSAPYAAPRRRPRPRQRPPGGGFRCGGGRSCRFVAEQGHRRALRQGDPAGRGLAAGRRHPDRPRARR
ncbi:PspC domain-containing protein [Arthrobacter sp. OVS8]|nr:PspC domain-containing protein [Arthrobacter sp. OVS8]